MTKFYLLLSRYLTVLFIFTAAVASAQNRTVSGKVTSAEDASGMPGVSISEKGTSNGVITDADGNYSISVGPNAILVFSFVGMVTQEVSVGDQTTVSIELASDVTQLSEVVVVGYGVQQKKDLTGSVASLKAEDLNPGPITSPLQQLSGKLAGVNINQVGSEPGVNPSIRIRGITSLIGGNDPLVVVDGIQGGLSLLTQVPPSEIESIDILKDASATAIYGSRGAAGVVLVTTKKGKSGATTIEYDGVYSVETISNKLDMLSPSKYRAAAADREITGYDQGGNTDWLDAITQNGSTQNHNIAVGGGIEKFNYRASVTAILQDGIVINSGSKNYIGRLQASQKGLDDKLTLTYNINVSSLKRKFNGPGTVGTALSTRPTNPIYEDGGGYFYDNTLFSYTNPVARVKEIIDGDEVNNLFGSMRADYQIIDGLTGSFFGSWRKTDRVYGSYESRLATFGGASQSGIAVRSTDRSNERLMNLILNYKKSFGMHSIDASFIYEWQKQVYEGDFIRGVNFPNDDLGYYALQNAGTFGQGAITSYKNDRTLVSFVGRATYSYNSKYILNASLRRDGASVFGKNNKWANFPSVSAAWQIGDESFMTGQNIVSNLKLRAGFGITGNQQGLSPLNSVSFAGNNGNAFFGGDIIRNFAITQNDNPDLKWETKRMLNVGIDFGLFNDRFFGSIEYYTGETRDLLFNYTVPVPPFPFNSIIANVGTIKNDGLEAALNYIVVNNGDLRVTLGANLTTVRTEVKELSGTLRGTPLTTDYVGWGGADIIGVGGQNNDMSYLIKGQPLGTFYVFKHAGIDESGTQIVDDLNGNGTIDQGRLSKDRYVAGQALPKLYIGFTPSVSYKNWDLSMVVRGAYGHKIYNVRRAQLSILNRLGQNNVLSDALSTGIQNVAETSATDFWLEDGGFTRLENVTVGYRFTTADWKVIKTLRLSFTSNNLFVITKYKGIDPEVRNDGGSGAGLDGGIYPRTRNFAVGVNVTFK
jgi:TonB-dependent starch-binding outer membrane protein SusC